MGQRFVARYLAVTAAIDAGGSAAGSGKRGVTQACEDARRACVPRVGDEECAGGVMQRQKAHCLFSLGGGLV